MAGFDKKGVLEAILEEAPVLTNLRKKITVKGREVVIYAYYFNRGEPDSELKYDREKNPVRTTAESTLCEIYSGWRCKKGEYSGPWLDDSSDGLNPSFVVRQGVEYRFLHVPVFFEEHFNKICERLGYEPRLSGNHVEIRRKAELELNGEAIPGEVLADSSIGIDLGSEDPQLSSVLDLIEKAYKALSEHYQEEEEFVFTRDIEKT